MRILALNHGPLVRAELFADVIREAGHDLVEWELPTRGLPPAGFDAVLVLGGSMNVGEEREHPWLEDEYNLLRAWVASDLPLLGICLGAQTLARAFAARVAPLAEPQLGFRRVTLTEEGRGDRLLQVLPARFDALLGNGYGFEVPPNGIELARWHDQPQAFRVGARAWGVQFHPEARRAQFLQWFEGEQADRLPRPLGEVERELDAKLATWHGHGRRLCLAFLAAAAAPA